MTEEHPVNDVPLAERNEERRKTLRGRIRRAGAIGGLILIAILTVYIFALPLVSETVAAHLEGDGPVLRDIYGILVFGVLALCGVDGAIDAVSGRRR